MADFVRLIENIKKAALDAVEASKPVNIMYGTVISTSPLKINVEQKMTLEANQLVLARNVTEHTIEMTVNHITENALDISVSHSHGYGGEVDSYSGVTALGGDMPHQHGYSHNHSYGGITGETAIDGLEHNHGYIGRKSFIVHNGLVVGDEVILARMQGGQKFIVVDRLGVI